MTTREETIRRPFIHIENLNVDYSMYGRMELHDTLKGFIRADRITASGTEVPAQLLKAIKGLMRGYYTDSMKYSGISVPLISGRTVTKKSAATVLSYAFTRVTIDDICKILKFPVGRSTYYGGPGIILKEENGAINPMLLYTVTARTVPNPRQDSAATDFLLEVTDLNLRVAPSVFLDSDVMSRHIVRKLIPEICQTRPYQDGWYTDNYIVASRQNIAPKVIVEDLSDWVLQPSRPKVESFDQELRQFYADERIIDEIVDGL